MSERNGKSPLGALVPARAAVLVGEVELVLRDPVLAKLNEAWGVLDDADLREALEALRKMLVGDPKPPGAPPPDPPGGATKKDVKNQTVGEFLEGNFDHIVAILLRGAMPLLTRKLAAVIAIALDTRANRAALAESCPEACDRPDGKAAVSSAAFRAWVAEELTTSQAVYVLEQVGEVSGWADLGKRLWKLVAGVFQGITPATPEPARLPAASAT